MTAGILILAMGSLAVAALVWCLIGFTKALEEPARLKGLLIDIPKSHLLQKPGTAGVRPEPGLPVMSVTSKVPNPEENVRVGTQDGEPSREFEVARIGPGQYRVRMSFTGKRHGIRCEPD
jgi:hypothetical protein